jgi:hypothetical protein
LLWSQQAAFEPTVLVALRRWFQLVPAKSPVLAASLSLELAPREPHS